MSLTQTLFFSTDCSVCSKNYASSFGFTCNKCSDKTAGGITLAVILALVVLFFVAASATHLISGRMGCDIVSRLARFVPPHSIKIIIVVWQIITKVGSIVPVCSGRANDRKHLMGKSNSKKSLLECSKARTYIHTSYSTKRISGYVCLLYTSPSPRDS